LSIEAHTMTEIGSRMETAEIITTLNDIKEITETTEATQTTQTIEMAGIPEIVNTAEKMETTKGNIYPIERNNKIGFIDRDGNMIIEPVYDDWEWVWPEFLVNCRLEPGAIYYTVTQYVRDARGSIDPNRKSTRQVIGPNGQIYFRSDDREVSASAVLKNGWIKLYESDSGILLIDQDGRIIVSEKDNAWDAEECPDAGSVVLRLMGGECRLINKNGQWSDEVAFEDFFGSRGEQLFFLMDGHVVITDPDGKIIKSFPDLKELRPLGNGCYSYKNVSGADDFGVMDDTFSRITEPLFSYLYFDSLGQNFFAFPAKMQSYRIMLFDKKGRPMFNDEGITLVQESYVCNPDVDAIYYIAEYEDSSRKVFDRNCKFLFADTEDYAVQYIYGDLVVLTQKDAQEYAMNIKKISDGIDDDNWLLDEPVQSIYSLGRQYLACEIQDPRTYAITRATILDLYTGQTVTEEEFLSVSMVDVGMFSVRTAREKGYIDAKGKWIYRVSVFDSLDMGD